MPEMNASTVGERSSWKLLADAQEVMMNRNFPNLPRVQTGHQSGEMRGDEKNCATANCKPPQPDPLQLPVRLLLRWLRLSESIAHSASRVT